MQGSNYDVHDVQVREVPFFGPGGKAGQVTRVSIMVGDHGPFTKDFGPGQDQPATPEAINTWKQQQVVFAMSVAGK